MDFVEQDRADTDAGRPDVAELGENFNSRSLDLLFEQDKPSDQCFGGRRISSGHP